MSEVKVFGHRPPDTDAVGSAILWAWYLNNHTTHDATAYVLGDLNKETSFVLNRWKISQPELLESIGEKDTVVIVDTNNPQELFENINTATIMQIIDHHKLVGGLITSAPLEMTIRPLASTASVIHDLLEAEKIALPDNMAGLMLSCILSDTLEFRSPTTTPHDKDIVERLAKQVSIDVSAYAQEMFAAKSDIGDFTDLGLIHLDSKKFEVGDKNLRVSVVETTNPQMVLDRKDGLIKAMESVKAGEHDVDDVLFFVVDILKEEATVIVHNDFVKGIIEASFDVDIAGDREVLPGIVSRKKQIVPALKLPSIK